MASYSRCLIFSPTGIPLAELETAGKRSWVINGVGRFQFDLPVYSSTGSGFNPKLTPSVINYGNYVLVQHEPSRTTAYDGTIQTNGTLPDWAGVIWTPQTWDGKNAVTVTCMSVEQVLKWRPMPITGPLPAQTPGQLFSLILQYANQLGGLRIHPGAIHSGGASIQQSFSVSGLEHAQQMAQQASVDFDVTARQTTSGLLELYGNLYAPKGINTNRLISNLNRELSPQLYTEQSDFFNVVIVYSDAVTQGTRVLATAIDTASVSQHGAIGTNVKYTGTAGVAADVAQAFANAYLAAHKQPVKTFAPTILDVGNIFSYLAVGNTFRVDVDNVGLGAGGVGLQGTARITAVEFDERINSAKLAVAMQ